MGDGASLRVLFREMAALYAAFTKGLPSPLPALPLQYADYAAWQRQSLRAEAPEQPALKNFQGAIVAGEAEPGGNQEILELGYQKLEEERLARAAAAREQEELIRTNMPLVGHLVRDMLTEPVRRRHGLALSDPVGGTFRILATTDGGRRWNAYDTPLVAGPVAEFTDWRAGVLAVSLLSAAAAVLFVRLAPAPRGFRPVVRGQGPKLAERILINLRSPRLLALYTQGFLLMGGFVAVYNYLGFRLEAPPFNLPTSLASLLFLAYLAGTVSSRLAGGLTVRFGRLRVLLASIPVIIAGLAITLADSLPVILVGLVVFTGGFFGAHSVASGWTPRLATVGQSQASGLYNLFYYAGSSLLGWAGGLFFVQFGWSGVAIFAAVLALFAGTTAVLALRGSEAK